MFIPISLQKKCYIIDLDGTIFLGDEPIEESCAFIKRNYKNFDSYFLTNNTSHIPSFYVKKLGNAGINCSLNQIITPLYSLIQYLKKRISISLSDS